MFGTTQAPGSSSSSSAFSSTDGTGFTSFSTSRSAQITNFASWVVPTTLSYESNFVTTNSTALDTTVISIYGTGSDRVAAASTVTTNALTSTFSTRPGTTTLTTGTNATGSYNFETALVVVGDASTEWLWKFTDENPTASFLTDCAESFSSSIFWPETTAIAISFDTYSNSNATTGTYSVPGNLATYTVETISDDPVTFTITSGDNFSRDTATTDDFSHTTDSFTFEAGIDSSTVRAISTHSYSTTTAQTIPVTLHTLYSVINGTSEATVLGTSQIIASTSLASAGFSYFASNSTATGATTNMVGQTINETDVSQINLLTFLFGGQNTFIAPAPFNGALLAPQKLHSTTTSYLDYGTNLNFDGGTVFYPFTVSVISNVAIPDPRNHSATDSDSHTWKYKWSFDSEGATLSYTNASTYLDGTDTSTDRTIGSGKFSATTISDTFVANGGSVLGGYQGISTAGESAYYPPRAARGTSIDFMGGTTSYQSVYTDSSSTTVSDSMIVETSLPAYQVFTVPTDSAVPAFTSFARNYGA